MKKVNDAIIAWRKNEDAEVTFKHRTRMPKRYSHGPRKVRVFVSGNPDPEDLGFQSQPPYSAKGDDPDNDKAWKDYNRLEVATMKHFAKRIEGYIRKTLGDRGIFPAEARFDFSRYAGCSCPCSPGFITNIMANDTWTEHTFYVSITTPAREAAAAKADAERKMNNFDPSI